MGALVYGAVSQWDASAGKWNLVSDYLRGRYGFNQSALIQADSLAFAARKQHRRAV